MSENPQVNQHESTLSPRVMYQYGTHRNIPWNIIQYSPKKQYLDPAMQALQRKYSEQKKGQKDRRYLTKKGNYMDYHNKIAKTIPGPPTYQQNQPWNFDKEKKQAMRLTVNKNLIKYTYLDRIQMDQKNKSRKGPGIGTYSLQKSLKEKEAQAKALSNIKRHQGQKHFFHDDIFFLGNKSPGAGNYNPRNVRPRLRLNKTDKQFWIDKHNKMNATITQRQSKKPGSLTYSPMYQTFTTFDTFQNAKKKENDKKNCFGTDSRFQYTRPSKKTIIEKRPDPAMYNTTLQWRSKTLSPKKALWQDKVWKGFTKNIYQ